MSNVPAGGVLARASEFLWTHARLVERRAFECAFAGGSADAVVDAVRAYRNADGGLGHALEPDLRTPTSQPIFVHAGMTILHEVSASEASLVAGACAFLARIARTDGAIPYALPDARDHARADHWNGDFAFAPSLLATSGLAGSLHALGARHEWLDRATSWCFDEIAGHPGYSGHRMLNVLALLRHAPDRDRAARLWNHVTSRLFEGDYVVMKTPITSYGLSPLRFAPTPDAPARVLFPDTVIDEHLDHLVAQQQTDGGWPVFWDPPGPAAVVEWRGRWTLDALLALRAYGRI
jgi:hypothetical protein